jgi:hypothetical protein
MAVKMTNGIATEPDRGSACNSPALIPGLALTTSF